MIQRSEIDWGRDRPAHPSSGWPHESLFNRISRTAMTKPINPPDASMLGRAGITNPLLAYSGVRRGKTDVLDAMLDCAGWPKFTELGRLTGADLLTLSEQTSPSEGRRNSILCSSLRYCRTCMELGYHSMLFQHWAVTRCPLHGVELLNSCFECGQLMVPSIRKIVVAPYTCHRCGRLLIKTAYPSGAAYGLRLVDSLIRDWHRDVAEPAGAFNARIATTHLATPSAGSCSPNAQRVRLLHRAVAWPAVPSARWANFEEVRIPVDSDGSLLRFHPGNVDARATERPPTWTLNWLGGLCALHRWQSLALMAGSWMRIQHITPRYEELDLSAISVALHLTMTRYAKQSVDFHGLRSNPKALIPLMKARWNGFHSPSTSLRFGQASGELVSMEILAYFALSLLRCVGLNPLGINESLAATEAFEISSYCPTWRLEREGHEWIMRMRPRVGQELVRRLLWRYRHAPLRRMVVCSAPTGPDLPESSSVDPPVPIELAHFPQGERCGHGLGSNSAMDQERMATEPRT